MHLRCMCAVWRRQRHQESLWRSVTLSKIRIGSLFAKTDPGLQRRHGVSERRRAYSENRPRALCLWPTQNSDVVGFPHRAPLEVRPFSRGPPL
eukprot:4721980-Pyramimonas_sp.AAC.1